MTVRPGTRMRFARAIVGSSIDVDGAMGVVLNEGDVGRMGNSGCHWIYKRLEVLGQTV